MIKPEFFDDPAIAELSPLARLFFIGLWMQADREGRLPDDCKRLKARIFPYDDTDTEALAVELHGSDMIRRYSGPDGKNYIWIRTFVKHQRPHPKEPASLIPPCGVNDGKRNGVPCLKTEGTPESGFLILDSGTRNLDSGKRKLEHGAKTALMPVPPPPTRADGRGKRPIFTGQRLTVFEWMLDDCMQTLGPLSNDFDLHEWFFSLDALAAKANMVIPKRDSGAWLQAQLLEEAKRRNLPIAAVTVAPKLGRVGVIAQAVADIQREERQR